LLEKRLKIVFIFLRDKIDSFGFCQEPKLVFTVKLNISKYLGIKFK